MVNKVPQGNRYEGLILNTNRKKGIEYFVGADFIGVWNQANGMYGIQDILWNKSSVLLD